MLKKLNKIRDFKYQIAAAIAVGAMAPATAHADGGTVGTIADGLITQLSSVGKVVLAGGAIAGIVLMITGLIKLKQAAETQGQQVKYSEGLWRCVVGAGLIAIPALNGVLAQTVGFGADGGASLTAGGGQSF
ncbi:hypothetical protein [Rhizobium sp. MHM7A]|uniref:hypothetical protein n=1 Tax=Rhizobium sp. MHM7A TaxID=2583233 RepID=UPI001106205C|nr:hypothetical protein [Rhizobium sp. MHM7A]TLX15836.1 hypothetical protein FFR93_00540 [Rhizobium sp. MHM7A]